MALEVEAELVGENQLECYNVTSELMENLNQSSVICLKHPSI